MDEHLINPSRLVKALIRKSSLKQEVYFKTHEVFHQFKTESERFIASNRLRFYDRSFRCFSNIVKGGTSSLNSGLEPTY